MPGDESYKGITENVFNDVRSNPLSTFSVDVDAASYSNVRRFINGGQLPPADAVRIEEMINYFSYNLPGPVNGEPVAIHTELSSAPWNTRHRLLRIGMPEVVFWTGLVHGILFLLYVAAVAHAHRVGALSRWLTGWALVASVLPAGPFVLDARLRKPEPEPAEASGR